MDILKTATTWAKTEVFSASFFIVFGVLFLVASLGFWRLGQTATARAYVIPTLVAGGLLLIIGIGLVYANQTRISTFETAYREDPAAFVRTELDRAERTLKEYQTIVFTAIPLIIIACALLILLTDKPVWRASAITTIALLTLILLIDGTAHARIAAYNQELERVEK